MTLAVACIIPAFEAEATLPAVLTAARLALPDARLIVVDDGSTDGTASVARTMADEVVTFTSNTGKGAALRAGFAAAIAGGATAILTMDADGQHDPAYAPRLVEALATADLVIGARERTPRMPIHRRISNGLSSRTISWIAGRRFADSQSGYRAFRREVLDVVRAHGQRYEFETDFLIRAARAGLRITDVRVPTIYGTDSHFRELRDALRIMFMMLRHRLGLAR